MVNLPNKFTVERKCGRIIKFTRNQDGDYCSNLTKGTSFGLSRLLTKLQIKNLIEDGVYKIIDDEFQKHRERLINA